MRMLEIPRIQDVRNDENAQKNYLQFRGTSRLILGIIKVVMWFLGLYLYLLSPSDPPANPECPKSVGLWLLQLETRSPRH